MVGLAGVRKLFSATSSPATQVKERIISGGASVATERLGQFMPKAQKATTYGVTSEELEWARERGAGTDAEAAELIFEHRKSIVEPESVSPSGS